MWEIQRAADAIATQEAKEPGLQARLFPERRRKKLVETFADLISCLSLPSLIRTAKVYC
jgi:hypothetical protein